MRASNTGRDQQQTENKQSLPVHELLTFFVQFCRL